MILKDLININHRHFNYSTLNKLHVKQTSQELVSDFLFLDKEKNNSKELINEIKKIAKGIQCKINNGELSKDFIQSQIEHLNNINNQFTTKYTSVLVPYIVFMSIHRDILSNGKRSRFRTTNTSTLNSFLQQINKKHRNKDSKIFISLIKFYTYNLKVLIDLGLDCIIYKNLLSISCKNTGEILIEINNKVYKVTLKNNKLNILHDQGNDFISYYKDNLHNFNQLILLGLKKLIFKNNYFCIHLLLNADKPVILLDSFNKNDFIEFYRDNYVELNELNLNQVKYNNINYILYEDEIENNVEKIDNVEYCYINKLQRKSVVIDVKEGKYFNDINCREKIYQWFKKNVNNEQIINYFNNLLIIDTKGSAKNILPNSTVVVGDSDGSIGREILAAILSGKMLLTKEGIEKLFVLMMQEYNALYLHDGLIKFQKDSNIYDLIMTILKNTKFIKSPVELIFLGDSVLDRFTNNKLAHMLLRRVLVNFCRNTIYIKGNHDDVNNILHPIKGDFNSYQFGCFSKKDMLDISLEYHIKKIFKNCYYDAENQRFYIHNGITFKYKSSNKYMLQTAFGIFNLLSYAAIEDLVQDINLGKYKEFGTSFRPQELDNFLVAKEIQTKFGLKNFTIIHGHTGYQEDKIDYVYNLNSRINKNDFPHLPACKIFEMNK